MTQVLAESQSPDAVRGQMVHSAIATVRYLRDIWAISDSATHDAFVAAGFTFE